MKLIALAIIFYVLIYGHSTLDVQRPNMRPPDYLGAIAPDDQSTTDIAPASQEIEPKTEKSVFFKFFKLDEIKIQEVEKHEFKETQELRAIQFENFCTIIFILILVILAGLDIIFLQLMFKKNLKTVNVAIVTVTSFVVAINFVSFLFILRAASETDHGKAQH